MKNLIKRLKETQIQIYIFAILFVFISATGTLLINGNLKITGSFISGSDTLTSTKLVNRYTVGTKGQFTTIPAAITWLNTHMTAPSELLLDGGTFTLTDSLHINLQYALNIRGLTFFNTTVQAGTGLTGKPMIVAYSPLTIERIYFKGSSLGSYGTLSGEDCIRIKGNGLFVKISEVYIRTFRRGINVLGNSSVLTYNSIIAVCFRGIDANSTAANYVDFEMATIDSCNIGINFQKGVGAGYYITNVLLNERATDTCFNYASATYTSYSDQPAIIGVKWNNLGVFQTGWDFARADGRDANMLFISNTGTENKTPHFKVNVQNSTDTVKFTTQNVWKKAKYTIASTVESCKWTIGTNRFTYQPTNKRDIWIVVSGNFGLKNSNNTMTIAIVKNGVSSTRYAEMNNYYTVPANNQIAFAPMFIYLTDVLPTDYFEIWYTVTQNNNEITLGDLQIGSWCQ